MQLLCGRLVNPEDTESNHDSQPTSSCRKWMMTMLLMSCLADEVGLDNERRRCDVEDLFDACHRETSRQRCDFPCHANCPAPTYNTVQHSHIDLVNCKKQSSALFFNC